MQNKKLWVSVLTVFLLFFIASSAEAKVMWGKTELKQGQLGKITVKKAINLWERDANNRLSLVRVLKSGEEYRVYRYDNLHGGQYGLGGGMWITKVPTHIKYETPSKSKLAELEREKSGENYDIAFAGQTINVKASPGSSYQTIGKLQAGDIVHVYGGVLSGWNQYDWYLHMNGWSKIKYQNQYGYVLTDELSFADPYRWAPGIYNETMKEIKDNNVTGRDQIKLEKLGITDSQGHYIMYIKIDGKGDWQQLVVINCKTGWYHG